jgi:hypothetical protein
LQLDEVVGHGGEAKGAQTFDGGMNEHNNLLINCSNPRPRMLMKEDADWLGLLIDHEVTCRNNRRLVRRLAAAKQRQAATIEKRTVRHFFVCKRPSFLAFLSVVITVLPTRLRLRPTRCISWRG